MSSLVMFDKWLISLNYNANCNLIPMFQLHFLVPYQPPLLVVVLSCNQTERIFFVFRLFFDFFGLFFFKIFVTFALALAFAFTRCE